MGKFKSIPEAEDWRVRSRIKVEGMPSPWLTGQSTPPPISVMPKVQNEAAPMEDKDQTGELPPENNTGEDAGALGSLADAYPQVDFASLKPGQYGSLLNSAYANMRAAQQAEASNAQKEYDAAKARIAERNGGMSQSEMLFALSRAMLSPRKVPGFKGFLGSVMGQFGDIADANRLAAEKRAEEEAALRAQFMAQQNARRTAGTRTMVDLLKTYGTLNKPAASTLGYDTQRGITYDKNNPRPTENMYPIGKGRTLIQWQDGLWREPLPGGGFKVFERAGNTFNELRTEGPH